MSEIDKEALIADFEAAWGEAVKNLLKSPLDKEYWSGYRDAFTDALGVLYDGIHEK